MIELKPRDWDTPEYDSCGSTSIAELNIHNIKIPLCTECLEELKEEVDKFNKMIFCKDCIHVKAKPEYNYYSCNLKYKEDHNGEDLPDEHIGYYNGVDSMSYCPRAKKAEESKE
jgi:hypothetical protein